MSIAEERALLRKEIEKWRKIQAIYMPGLLQYLSNMEQTQSGSTADSDKAEEVKLWLPSSLEKKDYETVCSSGLTEMEERLRVAQCYDSLSEIRNTLQLKSRMVLFKNKNVRGQRDGTKSRTLIDRVHDKARKFAQRYRAARAAKLKLSGPGSWEKSLHVLHDSDIRGYQDPNRIKPKNRRQGTWEDSELSAAMIIDSDNEDGDSIDLFPEQRSKRDGTGQTRLEISWIWLEPAYLSGKSEPEIDDILRAEWAKSHARVKRATEEVLLLREEMRRVLAYLEWKANWWSSRQALRSVEDITLKEGLYAYCTDQASLQNALKASFQKIWKLPLENSNTNIEGENEIDSDEEEEEEEEEDDFYDTDDEM